MRASNPSLGCPSSVPCSVCGYKILILAKPGKYDLGCPECPARTPIEVVVERQMLRVLRLAPEGVSVPDAPRGQTRTRGFRPGGGSIKRASPVPTPSPALREIPVGDSSESKHIAFYKRYLVRIGRSWHEGSFSKRWFGWQFDGYQSGIQLNLLDEVYEILE